MSHIEIVMALKQLSVEEQANVLQEVFGTLTPNRFAALLLLADYVPGVEHIAFTKNLETEAPYFPDETSDFLDPYEED